MKSNKKTSLFIGSIIVLLLISTPYFLFFYKNIPSDVKNLDTVFGVIESGYYSSIQSFLYNFFSKLVPLALLLIWFLTNKHWWVHALIIPLSVYLFQFISVINDSTNYVDEVEFIYTVPFLVLILVILYFVRSKLSIYIQAVDLKKEMDENMRTPKKFG